eukprot:COSAG06_NODE_775_length_12397_cov_15.034071_14_plen_247_part_00
MADSFEVDGGNDGRTRVSMQNPMDESPDGRTAPSSPAISPKTRSKVHPSLASEESRVLDMQERKWLQNQWFKLDTSGDGLLQYEETEQFLKMLRNDITPEGCREAFEDMDEDHMGTVDFDEFYLWFARQDAFEVAHLMSVTAHKEFLIYIAFLAIFMFLPGVAIIGLSGPDPVTDPLEFLYCLMFMVIPLGILGSASFMDAYGPSMQAKAKAGAMGAKELATATLALAPDVVQTTQNRGPTSPRPA